jgi:Flp pilus assembly protein TadG
MNKFFMLLVLGTVSISCASNNSNGMNRGLASIAEKNSSVICVSSGRESMSDAIEAAQQELNNKLTSNVQGLTSVSQPAISSDYAIYNRGGYAHANICVTVTAKGFNN